MTIYKLNFFSLKSSNVDRNSRTFNEMKIAALFSIVAAERQGQDAQSLFDEMFGGRNNTLAEKKFLFSETNMLHQVSQFYMWNAGIRVQNHLNIFDNIFTSENS